MAGDLAEYWWLRGEFTEGCGWLEQTLALDGGDPALRASALYGASGLRENLSDLATALAYGYESLTLATTHGDILDILRAEIQLTGLTANPGNQSESASRARRAHELAQSPGNERWLGYSTIGMGYMTYRAGESERAAAFFEEAVTLCPSEHRSLGRDERRLCLGYRPLTTSANELRPGPRSCARWKSVSRLPVPWGVLRGMVGLAAIRAADGEVVTGCTTAWSD